MIRWMRRIKRPISYILFYALLCGVVGTGVTDSVSAALQQRGYRTAVNYLQTGQTATQAGIMIDGKKVRLETYGSHFFVVDRERENGFAIIATEASMATTGSGAEPEPVITTVGEGLVATGTAVSLAAGISEQFEISGKNRPALFSFRTSKLAGQCRQFRIITEAAQGFGVWLLDQNLQPVSAVSGVGGSNVLRYVLPDYTSYYLLVSGEADTSGRLLYSDIMDDYGGDFLTAGDLAFNKDYVIETETAGDVDVLTFWTSSDVSTYRMNIQSLAGSDGTFEMLDQNGQVIGQYSGAMGAGMVDTVFQPEIGKRYYFRFTSGQTGRKILLHISQATTRYRITYHLHGGKNDKANPSSYVSTSSRFVLRKATRSKYLFDGWYTDTSYRTRVYSVQGTDRRNIDLHAKWKKVSPAKTKIIKARSKKKNRAVIKWKKVKGVRGYRLVYGTTRGLHKKTRTKVTKKNSLTIRGLKEGKTYYFKVCCYSKDSLGKKVYGKYSRVKKVKIKAKKKKAAGKKATVKPRKPAKKTAVKKKNTKKSTKKTAVKKKSTKKKPAKKIVVKKKNTKKSRKK